MTGRHDPHVQCVLFDWGDTVMQVFPEYPGPMENWPRVEAVPGVREAIVGIRRHALVGLATNAADSDEQSIRRALRLAELDALFDHIFCFDTVGHRKPTETFYRTVLGNLGLPAARVYMVGDDFEVDVMGANAVGIRAVWLNRLTPDVRSVASRPRRKT